jgi:predicted HNH restriction endonuclease
LGLHIALDAQHEVRMDRARAAALARDHHACRVCGSAARDIETHLWHQPRLLPSYATANLVSVCGRCHGEAHRRRARAWR